MRDRSERTDVTRTMETDDVEEEARIPLVEETAEVRKDVRQAGEVEISKRVETESQHISEPVTRERVTVDVQPVAPGSRPVDPDAALLPGETIRVPVHQEELVVEKQAHVGQEAVIRTERETEQAEQDVTLRRERLEVDETGDLDVDATNDRYRGRRS